MHSPIVVISWWSNCLALTCLHLLAKFAPGRTLYVMQAGKSDEQMDHFRRFLPTGASELRYPPHLPADDSRMRQYLALESLAQMDGAWFIDHDTFLVSPAETWFQLADSYFKDSDICLCTGVPRQGPGLTSPAYWLSPSRWPKGLSSFDPVPFQAKAHVRRPDLHRCAGQLALPAKDTLVKVAEELMVQDRAGTFPMNRSAAQTHELPAFPAHRHLGGIHLYTGPVTVLSPDYLGWMRNTVSNFEDFFSGCPKEWLAIEEPELLKRHREFRDAVAG